MKSITSRVKLGIWLVSIAAAQVGFLDCARAQCVAPCVDPVLGEVEAYLGTAADLTGLSVVFANESRPDRPRFDIIIADVPRHLFTNFFGSFGDQLTNEIGEPLPGQFGTGLGEFPGCGSPSICPGDEIAVDGFSATFTPANGSPPVVFDRNNVQIVAQEIIDPATGAVLGAEQNVVWVLWSIRFEDVTGLSPSTLVVRQGDTVLATFVLEGVDANASIAEGGLGADGDLLTAVDGNAAAPPAPEPPPPPAPPALEITKAELRGTRLRIEGINAVGTIFLNGVAVGVARDDGRFKIQERNYLGPCIVTVADSTAATDSADLCTP